MVQGDQGDWTGAGGGVQLESFRLAQAVVPAYSLRKSNFG